MGSLSDCSQALRRQGGAVEAPPLASPRVWRCQRLRAPAAPGAPKTSGCTRTRPSGCCVAPHARGSSLGLGPQGGPILLGLVEQAESPGKGARKPKGFYAHPRGCTAAYGTRRLRATDKLTVIYSELGSRAARSPLLARVRELETRGSVP